MNTTVTLFFKAKKKPPPWGAGGLTLIYTCYVFMMYRPSTMKTLYCMCFMAFNRESSKKTPC